MRVSVKIDKKKMYNKTKKELESLAKQVIFYGVNEIRNNAVTGIMQGTKSGTVRRDGSRRSAVGEFPATDTGFLQNNIVVSLAPDGMSGEAVSRAEYSSHLEFGTSKMGARPFMQPSAEQARPKIRRRLKQLFG